MSQLCLITLQQQQQQQQQQESLPVSPRLPLLHLDNLSNMVLAAVGHPDNAPHNRLLKERLVGPLLQLVPLDLYLLHLTDVGINLIALQTTCMSMCGQESQCI